MKAVVVCGLPGTGKSFFASKLATKLEAIWISSDVVRQESLQDKHYDEQSKYAVYYKMLDIMEDNLKADKNTVLDATFFKADIRKLFQERVQDLGASIFYIEINASENTVKQRISHKRPDSDADYEVYLKIKAEFEPLMRPHLVLYADTQPIDEMINQALIYLNDPTHEAR